MKAAGWARESTFRTFYDEPLSCSENLGNNLYPTVFTGLPGGKPSQDLCLISCFFNFFFRVGKSLAYQSPAKWCLCV